MDDAFTEGIELDTVARDAGLSRPHFFKLFRENTGVTPALYANTMRIERALDRLMRSQTSVTDIGYELGFSSQSHFTHFFSAHVGIAPTQYRTIARVVSDCEALSCRTKIRLPSMSPRLRSGSFRAKVEGARWPRRLAMTAEPGCAARGDALGRWVGHHPIAALAIAVVVIFVLWLVLAPWPAGFEDVFGKKRLFVNALFNGITLGGLYFLVATGFTLIFGLMRNVNLAHGSLYLFGGYMGYEATQWTGSWLFSYVVAFACCAVIGIAMQFLIFRRMEGRICGRPW